jgi:5'-nucleotidase
MTNRPTILITNDDGIFAPGIKHLWKALSPFADLVVVAPAAEQSAVSLSITIRHPLRIEKVDWPLAEEAQLWSINGTPADCVKLALKVILPTPPQLIVSGINRGTNAGRNVLYSGTVAAVIEGTMHNIPGIAFSAADYFEPDYESASSHILPIVKYALENTLPQGTFLNVNFPRKSMGEIKGIRLAKQGKEYWVENPEHREHPAEGHSYYWLGAKLAEFAEEEGSDIALLREGYATAVPIHINDLTYHSFIVHQKEIFEDAVNGEKSSKI